MSMKRVVVHFNSDFFMQSLFGVNMQSLFGVKLIAAGVDRRNQFRMLRELPRQKFSVLAHLGETFDIMPFTLERQPNMIFSDGWLRWSLPVLFCHTTSIAPLTQSSA